MVWRSQIKEMFHVFGGTDDARKGMGAYRGAFSSLERAQSFVQDVCDKYKWTWFQIANSPHGGELFIIDEEYRNKEVIRPYTEVI